MRVLAAGAVPVMVPVMVPAGCSGSPDMDPGAGAEPSTPPSSSDTATATPGGPTQPPTPEPSDTLPPVTDSVSLAALMRERLGPTRITRTRLQLTTDAYTRHEVTYDSGGVTVSGILLVPHGRGPFPGVVLNHG